MPQDGHYLVDAYQAAFGLSLALQVAALVWFAIPWFRTFGEYLYGSFARRPAEHYGQAGFVRLPVEAPVLEAYERMEW